MAKKAFSIADYLAPETVSNVDTQSASIIHVPLERLRENSLNFYDTSDVAELVASIELNGLIEPLIVLEEPEHQGHYRIISGHRRYKAICELAAEQPDKWASVPAIVRNPEDAVAEELLLIEANRATRVMSPADTMHQAERYKELLVKLKERGVNIPGRLRNAVAEAMQISATRLARLDVIRKNLIPVWMEKFESGALAETTAYELARCTPAVQDLMSLGLKASTLTSERVHDLKDYAADCLKKHPCTVNPSIDCEHGAAMWVEGKSKPYYSRCVPGHYSSSGKCCADCRDYDKCGHACPLAGETVERRKAEAKALYEEQNAEEMRKQAAETKAASEQWQAMLDRLQAAGVSTSDIASSLGISEESLTRYVAGKGGGYYPRPDEFSAVLLGKLSRASGLSINEMLGEGLPEKSAGWPAGRDPLSDPPTAKQDVLVLDEDGDYEVDYIWAGRFAFTENPSAWWPLPPKPSGDVDDSGES